MLGQRAIRRYSTAKSLATLSGLKESTAPGFVFKSTSRNPFLNLAIEHYIFQNAPEKSRVLFLYVNRPSVVMGRNQNPWLEVDLQAINTSIPARDGKGHVPVDLVRRKSGGGTVFHDEGNVNWSFMCDVGDFTRDKHTELIVRALRGLRSDMMGDGHADRIRINQRHDIVFNTNIATKPPAVVDGALQYGSTPFKVSGSAYKIERKRALHHATTLLNSPHIRLISKILNSPARDYIDAKGVESIRSPVINLMLERNDFEEAAEREFRNAYPAGKQYPSTDVGEECLDIEKIRLTYEELQVSAP
jgi:lipoate-protein ligase A